MKIYIYKLFSLSRYNRNTFGFFLLKKFFKSMFDYIRITFLPLPFREFAQLIDLRKNYILAEDENGN